MASFSHSSDVHTWRAPSVARGTQTPSRAVGSAVVPNHREALRPTFFRALRRLKQKSDVNAEKKSAAVEKVCLTHGVVQHAAPHPQYAGVQRQGELTETRDATPQLSRRRA